MGRRPVSVLPTQGQYARAMGDLCEAEGRERFSQFVGDEVVFVVVPVLPRLLAARFQLRAGLKGHVAYEERSAAVQAVQEAGAATGLLGVGEVVNTWQ